MFHSATALVAAFHQRHPAASGTVDLAASADPDFGGDKVTDIQAAGVLSFSGNRTVNVKATEHFLVLGNLVKPGDVVEVPEKDGRYLTGPSVAKAVYATDDDLAAAAKSTKAAK
jgi:hypothetical protein